MGIAAVGHRGDCDDARHRSEARRAPTGDDGAVGERLQQLAQLGGAPGVAEQRPRADEQRDRRQPVAVARDLGQAGRAAERLERPPRMLRSPDDGARVRGGGAPHGRRRVAARELLERLLDLAQAALHHPQREELDGVELRRVLGLHAATGGERLAREPLGVRHPPFEHRPIGLVQRHVPEVQGVAQLVGEPPVDRELDVGADPVAELHERQDPPDMPAQDELAIARLLAERDHVGGDLQAPLRVLRPPQRQVPRAERRGDRRAVADPARHRDRVLAEL